MAETVDFHSYLPALHQHLAEKQFAFYVTIVTAALEELGGDGRAVGWTLSAHVADQDVRTFGPKAWSYRDDPAHKVVCLEHRGLTGVWEYCQANRVPTGVFHLYLDQTLRPALAQAGLAMAVVPHPDGSGQPFVRYTVSV